MGWAGEMYVLNETCATRTRPTRITSFWFFELHYRCLDGQCFYRRNCHDEPYRTTVKYVPNEPINVRFNNVHNLSLLHFKKIFLPVIQTWFRNSPLLLAVCGINSTAIKTNETVLTNFVYLARHYRFRNQYQEDTPDTHRTAVGRTHTNNGRTRVPTKIKPAEESKSDYKTVCTRTRLSSPS